MRSGDDDERVLQPLCVELCGIVGHYRYRDLVWRVLTTLDRLLNMKSANSAAKSKGNIGVPIGGIIQLTSL